MTDPAGSSTPTHAATALGVSASTLRRLAQFYEAAFGSLPDDGRGRVYPADALKRIERARDLYDAGKAPTLERAFEMLAGLERIGADPNDPDDLLLSTIQPEGQHVALQELRRDMRHTIRAELDEALATAFRGEALETLTEAVAQRVAELMREERREEPPAPTLRELTRALYAAWRRRTGKWLARLDRR